MLRSFLMALAMVSLTATVAHADVFVGTATFNDKNSGGAADFTAPVANFDLTTLVNPGDSITIGDFLIVSTLDTASKTNTQSDNLTLTYKFTDPSRTSVKETGVGTEVVTIKNKTDTATGSIDWDADGVVSVSFADQSVLDIALAFDPLDSTFSTTDGDQGLTLVYNATFTLEQAPTTVPEAPSLALLGAGLVALGGVRWARHARRNGPASLIA